MPASQAGRHGFESRRPLSLHHTMPSRPRVFALAACIIAAAPPPPPLVAQGQGWEPPQPPCDVKAGHFRVTSAIVNLKTAAEKPITRDRMLQQTNDVLTRAITNDGQGQNPGAWYYLGRYYVEMGDGAGADSAFRRAVALAPQCQQDIDRYRERLWVDVINAGMRNWQESRPDSAKLLLRQAAALRPGHPRAFLTLGQIYASENKLDSSAVFLGRAAAAAGNDTAFAEQKKDALGTVARLSARRLQADSAAQRWQRTRFSRDSIQRLLATDSVILTRIEASSASRRGRGARLAPADQQAFSRDSSGRARAAADRRAALAARASAVGARRRARRRWPPTAPRPKQPSIRRSVRSSPISRPIPRRQTPSPALPACTIRAAVLATRWPRLRRSIHPAAGSPPKWLSKRGGVRCERTSLPSEPSCSPGGSSSCRTTAMRS